MAQTYPNSLPHVFDPLDLDKDGSPGPGDKVLLDAMIVGANRVAGYPSSPASLQVDSAPTGSIAVGGTTHVTLSVHNAAGTIPHSSGFGVVFFVASGPALLLGGDGTAQGEASGNRYDVSMESVPGAKANMVVLITGPGAVTIGAKIPACGSYPNGRWCDEIVLNPAIVINGP